MKKLNQGTMTEKALSIAREKVKELEGTILQMFKGGMSTALWKKFLTITREIDELWAELDVSCWTLGLLSPWVPQEKHGEPTLAQLAGDILAFTPESDPDLWKWPTLKESVEFLEGQQIVGRDQWSKTVSSAADQSRKHPISIRFASQIEEFRDHLKAGLAAGDSVQEFKNRIKDTIDSTDAEVERNFRTSSKRAYLDGVDGVTRKNRFPYVKYVATEDNRTRPTHRAMDGKILKVGTPEYDQAQALQREYNCRCTLIPMTEKQAEREGFPVDKPKVPSALPAQEKVAAKHVEYVESRPEPQKQAVQKVAKGGFAQENRQLRAGRITTETRKEVRKLDAVIKSAPKLPEQTVYRGVSGKFGQEIATKKAGESISDKGYQAVSVAPAPAAQFSQGVMLRIHMDGKVKGLFVESPTQLPGDREIILERGIEWVVIGRSKEVIDGRTVVVLDVEPKT